jgi:hypothetical protein
MPNKTTISSPVSSRTRSSTRSKAAATKAEATKKKLLAANLKMPKEIPEIITHITDRHLMNRPYLYSVKELAHNMDHLNKKLVLSTQRLTAEFCIQYIWDTSIDGGSEDTYLFDFDYILDFQTHLKKEDLIAEEGKLRLPFEPTLSNV